MIVEMAQARTPRGGADKIAKNLPFWADDKALPLFPLLMEAWLDQSLPLALEQIPIAA